MSKIRRHLKFLDRYTCEFDFIPNMLTSFYMSGKIDDDFMTNPMEWKKILPKFGFGYDFGLRNLVVKKSEKKSKRAKFLITFPKPKVVPECFYAILYIDKSDYDYYTLELDLGSPKIYNIGGGIICGQKGSSHLNYGRRCIDYLEEFENVVDDIIEGTPFDCKNMVKDIDFNAAAEELNMKEDELKENCNIF